MNKKIRFSCDCGVIHGDIVKKARAAMPKPKDIADLAGLYKMLGDNTRLKLLFALSDSEMCVCDLAVLLGMTKSAVSHQLKLLRLSNLVKFEKDGKIFYYSLTDNHVKEILEKGFKHSALCKTVKTKGVKK